MKIDEISPKDHVQRSEPESRDKTSVKSENFKKFLAGELDLQANRTMVDSSGEPATGKLMETLPTALLLGIEEPQNNLSETGSAVSQLSSRLDNIVQVLEQQNVPLKTLGNAISSLSTEAENLTATIGELADQGALKGLSDELSVLAYVESVKWKRGDYI